MPSPDISFVNFIFDHGNTILNGSILAAVGWLVKLINERFRSAQAELLALKTEINERLDKTNTHLASLNNRVHKVEQKAMDDERVDEAIQRAHSETRRQCQEHNARELQRIDRSLNTLWGLIRGKEHRHDDE